MWEQKRPHRKPERGSQGQGLGRRERPQQTGRDGTAGVSSRVTSVAGADGFSVKPTTKLEASNRFRFHTAAQRWAAGMEAETPPPDRQRHSLPSLPGLGPRWFVRKPNKRTAIVAGAVVIGITALRFPAGLLRSPCRGGRRHWAGGSCCFTGPANLVGPLGAAGQTPLPLTAYAWGVSCHAAGRFHRGGGLSFSLCSRSPWRAGKSR